MMRPLPSPLGRECSYWIWGFKERKRGLLSQTSSPLPSFSSQFLSLIASRMFSSSRAANDTMPADGHSSP